MFQITVGCGRKQGSVKSLRTSLSFSSTTNIFVQEAFCSLVVAGHVKLDNDLGRALIRGPLAIVLLCVCELVKSLLLIRLGKVSLSHTCMEQSHM